MEEVQEKRYFEREGLEMEKLHQTQLAKAT
jgi:hypothetical protein